MRGENQHTERAQIRAQQELKIMDLLQGRPMLMREIAENMGLEILRTQRLVRALMEAECVWREPHDGRQHYAIAPMNLRDRITRPDAPWNRVEAQI